MRNSYQLPVIAIFSLVIISRVEAQNAPVTEPCLLQATYRLTYLPDSTSPETKSEQMQLLIGKTLSKFESIGQYKLDTLRARAKSQPTTAATMQQLGQQVQSFSPSTFKYSIYKVAASRQVSYYERIPRVTYRYDEPAILFNWVITPTTATIAGYKCQRATTSFAGRQFEAWFTKEIPVAEGPYKFYGLPGLIVQVGDVRHHYVFELLQLKKPQQEQLVSLPTEPTTTTNKTQFRAAKRDYELTLSDRIAAMGHPVSEEDRRDYLQRLKKKNNPLELR